MKHLTFFANKFTFYKFVLGIFLISILFLSACGQGGKLYLPQKQAQETAQNI